MRNTINYKSVSQLPLFGARRQSQRLSPGIKINITILLEFVPEGSLDQHTKHPKGEAECPPTVHPDGIDRISKALLGFSRDLF